MRRGCKGTRSLHEGSVWSRPQAARVSGKMRVRPALAPLNVHLAAQWPRGELPEPPAPLGAPQDLEHARPLMQPYGGLKPEVAGGNWCAWLHCEAPLPPQTPKTRECESAETFSHLLCPASCDLSAGFFTLCLFSNLKQKIWPRFGVGVHRVEKTEASFQGFWQPHQPGWQVKEKFTSMNEWMNGSWFGFELHRTFFSWNQLVQ